VKEHEQRQNDSRHDDFADNNVDSIVLEVPGVPTSDRSARRRVLSLLTSYYAA
jgi:hypothetical protein